MYGVATSAGSEHSWFGTGYTVPADGRCPPSGSRPEILGATGLQTGSVCGRVGMYVVRWTDSNKGRDGATVRGDDESDGRRGRRETNPE